jgi:hypothetical protein
MTVQRVGDDTAGFSVDVQAAGRVVVTGWGFWRLQEATAFGSVVIEACRSQPRGLMLTFDMRELKPMREEGQQSFSHISRALRGLGIAKTTIITMNPLTKLQLVRLVAESGAADVEWTTATSHLNRDA